MDTLKEATFFNKAAKVIGIVLVSLSLLCATLYLILGTYFHFQGYAYSVVAFALCGSVMFLACLLSLLMDLKKDPSFAYWSFFLSVMLALAFSLVYFTYGFHRESPELVNPRIVLYLLLANLLPLLGSLLTPIFRLAHRPLSLWILLACYVLEISLEAVGLYFSFTLASPITFLLFAGMIYLRAAQYLLLLPLHPLSPEM